MRRITLWLGLTIAVGLAVLGGRTITAQDTSDEKYAVQVPGGLAFSEFRGYERWQVVSISEPAHQRGRPVPLPVRSRNRSRSSRSCSSKA